jgi:hypothetical protein
MSAATVVPAYLSYLAIYNPALGPTDETVADQLVFYYSHKPEAELEKRLREKHAGNREQRSASDQTADDKRRDEADRNERLRQVGLAQGMVDFVK